MIDSLIKNYEVLVDIRKYLIKKGQSRYKGKVIETKLGEAKCIFDKCSEIFILLEKGKDVKLSSALSIFQNIKELYEEINNLCISPIKPHLGKMEFDLRVACNLIPVMDGVENTTKRLIDSTEMYANMIDDKGKDLLITFVLKSRLSENAKLRISGSYETVEELIKDLRCHLLPKKSFVAIQSKLQSIQQGSNSIDTYGTEVEKLFTELTISQAEGDSATYKVLKPLNEKLAIKRFSDGLRSSKLGTIISARNYSNLKDAIQAAKDEESASHQPSSGNIMHLSNNGRGSHYSRRPQRYQYQRRGYHNNRGQYYNNYNRSQQYYGTVYHRDQARRGNFRGNDTVRGNFRTRSNGSRGTRYFRKREQCQNMLSVEKVDDRQHSDDQKNNNDTSNQFFRG